MIPEKCPKCKASFVGDPIPVDQQHHYGAKHFSRCIGLSNGDSVYAWRCPDCEYVWDRWSKEAT